LCGHRSELKGHVCPTCGAVLNLQNAQAALSNPKAKHDLIRAGAARMAASPQAKQDFSIQYYLGMALLNLGRIDDALAHFRAAQKWRPNDPGFTAQINALEQHRNGARKPAHAHGPAPVPAPVPAPQPMVNFQRQAPERAQPKFAEPESGQKRILVVDDSPTIRKLVAMTVVKNGYSYLEANDGQEALDRIREHGVPDLVLLDIAMPRMDGYELCKILRQKTETAKLPIIMLSGKDGFFNKMRGKMAGSTLYLTKPFQPDALMKVIRKYAPVEGEPALV
jgi:twitching motility two-component system response regulator PilG